MSGNVAGGDFINPLHGAQEFHQPRLALENHHPAALFHQARITDKLKGVAQPLFGMEKNAPALER